MSGRTKVLIAAAIVAVSAAAGTGVVVASSGGGDDTEAPITSPAVEKASAAALEHTGGGKVTETEVGDEESLYEVEVTLDDGSQVDVQLDENFKVVGSSADDESEDEGAEGDDTDNDH